MESTNPKPVLSREQTLANMEDRKHAGFDFNRIDPEHPRLRYWECLAELVKKKIDSFHTKGPMPPSHPGPDGGMSYEEAMKFQMNTVFPRGKWGNTEVHRVPCAYIDWWVDQKDEFTKELERYTKSVVYRDRRDREGDEDDEITPE